MTSACILVDRSLHYTSIPEQLHVVVVLQNVSAFAVGHHAAPIFDEVHLECDEIGEEVLATVMVDVNGGDAHLPTYISCSNCPGT